MPWPATFEELEREQHAIAATSRDAEPWRPAASVVVASAFVAFDTGTPRAWAAAVALDTTASTGGRFGLRPPDAANETEDRAVVEGEVHAEYRPGYLALRQGLLLERAVRALRTSFDVLLVDATGADHPRRAGLALHIGAVLGVPTIGVTDRPLVGLVLDGEVVASLVRTRADARPVLVHAGWRTSVATAVEVVRSLPSKARTPEPLRLARRLAREARSVSRR